MKIKKYAGMKELFALPDQMECAGNVVDKKSGHVLAVGINTKRKLYAELGYICDTEAPDALHACACAMIELVIGMPVIKTVLLTPDQIYGPICEGETPTEELIYYSNMVLCALNQAFQGYLKTEKEGDSVRGESIYAENRSSVGGSRHVVKNEGF